MEGFSFVMPVTGLNIPNTEKEDDDDDDKMVLFKGEWYTGGKISKERITVLLCANLTGMDKLKSFDVWKYRNPWCLKICIRQVLPQYKGLDDR
jgi:hypothetical protein